MTQLDMTIVTETNQDYDGNDETIKKVTGCIDMQCISTIITTDSTTTDADAKQLYRDAATADGYTWTTEG